MSDAHALFQPADDPASVDKVLQEGIYTFYRHRGTVRPRKSPLDFLSSEQKDQIAELSNDDGHRVGLEEEHVNGSTVLKSALRRAAEESTMLASLSPAILDRVIDAIASENSVLMEVKSQRGPLVTATGLYSMVDSIAQSLGGQVALDQWVASNLTPAMKIIAYNPVIRERIIASVDSSTGQFAVSLNGSRASESTPTLPVGGTPISSTRGGKHRRPRKDLAKIPGMPYPTFYPTEGDQNIVFHAGPMRTVRSYAHPSLPRRPLQPTNGPR